MVERLIPKPGEWVLFRSTSAYDPVRVDMKQAAKVTPAMVKFETGSPRQCSIISVVASYPDKATAERVRDAIGGVAGEFQRRRRSAEDDRSKRITEALAAANRKIERLVSTPITRGGDNET